MPRCPNIEPPLRKHRLDFSGNPVNDRDQQFLNDPSFPVAIPVDSLE